MAGEPAAGPWVVPILVDLPELAICPKTYASQNHVVNYECKANGLGQMSFQYQTAISVTFIYKNDFILSMAYMDTIILLTSK